MLTQISLIRSFLLSTVLAVTFLLVPAVSSAAIPTNISDSLKAGGVNLVFDWYDIDTYNPTGFDAELPLIYAAGGRNVRLVISMDTLENGTTGSLRADRWADLKNFLAKAKANGLVTIIDIHNTGLKNPDGSWTHDYMYRITDPNMQARHTKLSIELAQKSYAELDRNWIVLQVGNEPLADAWLAYQDGLMPKLRAACPDCVMVAFTTNWQSMGTTMWTLNPTTKSWWDDRFIIDLHMYAPVSLTHCSFPGIQNTCPGKTWPGYYNDWLPVSGTQYAGTWDKNTLKAEFDKFWAWRSAVGNPTVYFSEIGTTWDVPDNVRGPYMKDVTDLLYANGAGWSCYEWRHNFGIKNFPLTKAACFRGSGTVTPPPPPPPPATPSCSITAQPSAITQGQSTTLTYSATNATAGSINNSIGSITLPGSKTVSPTANTTYVLTVTGAGGSATCQSTVSVSTVTPPPPPPPPVVPPPPPVTPPVPPPITQKFNVGDRVKVSTGPLKVRKSGSTSAASLGTQKTNALGTVIGGPVTQDGYTWWNVNYDRSPDGWSVENFLEKTTTPPKVSLSASPSSIKKGQASTLAWNSYDSTSCTGSGFSANSLSGSVSVAPTASTNYSITCTGAGGAASANSAITVSDVVSPTPPPVTPPVTPTPPPVTPPVTPPTPPTPPPIGNDPIITAYTVTNNPSVALGTSLAVKNTLTADRAFTGHVINKIYTEVGTWKHFTEKIATNVSFAANTPVVVDNMIEIPTSVPSGTHNVSLEVYDSAWKNLLWKQGSTVSVGGQTTGPTSTGDPQFTSITATNATTVAQGSSLAVQASIVADRAFTGIVQANVYDGSGGGWKLVAAKYTTNVSFAANSPVSVQNLVPIPNDAITGQYSISIDVFDSKWKHLKTQDTGSVTITAITAGIPHISQIASSGNAELIAKLQAQLREILAKIQALLAARN